MVFLGTPFDVLSQFPLRFPNFVIKFLHRRILLEFLGTERCFAPRAGNAGAVFRWRTMLVPAPKEQLRPDAMEETKALDEIA